MILWRYYFNYTLCKMDGRPEGSVFVVTRSGERRVKWWLGFIDVEIAKQIPGGRPVKIDVNEYAYGEDFYRCDWITVPQDRCMQGCLVRHGVYGVTVNGEVRIVPRPALRYRI